MSTSVETAPAPSTPRMSRTSSLLRVRELGIALLIVLVFVAATAKNSDFASVHSIQQLLTGAAIIGLLCVGETLVVVTRNVDLSVGSVIGAINGLVVTVFRVPSLVVTLAGLYIIRGIDGIIVQGVTINPSSIPEPFQKVGYATVLGVPWLFLIVAVVVAVVGYAMRSYRAARDLYAIGSNPDAAALAGIPSGKRVFSAFLISGTLAGLGGALFLALHATVDVRAGTGYELLVISAVVVGGVAIFGGSGSVFGAALAALLLNTINQALVSSRVSAFWTDAIAGALLLAAIAFDHWLSLRVTRSLTSAEGAHRDV
jgi:rhamnose transport system permease protein